MIQVDPRGEMMSKESGVFTVPDWAGDTIEKAYKERETINIEACVNLKTGHVVFVSDEEENSYER